MIQLSDISSKLSDMLNEAITSKDGDGKYIYPVLNGEDENGDKVEPQQFYRFNIATDTADYKRPYREHGSNAVTTYINGVLSRTGGVIEGNNENTVNSTLTAVLTFAVKVNTQSGDTPELVNTIGNLVNTVFANNTQGSLTDGGKTYQYGMYFTPMTSGNRQQLPYIGDSFTFQMYISFYIVESGVNSTDIEISVNGNRIYPITYGFNRSSQQETVVNSGSEGLSAGCVTTATVMTFSFVVPMRSDYISKEINSQIDTPTNTVYTVKKKVNYPDGTSPEKTFNMQFRECNETGENVKNVGLSATMTEVLKMPEVLEQ